MEVAVVRRRLRSRHRGGAPTRRCPKDADWSPWSLIWTRGHVVEAYRAHWPGVPGLVQWNAVVSRPGTLRGVHLHLDHSDYLYAVSGPMLVGLRDLRRDSSTSGQSALLELRPGPRTALVIAPGVAHGFFSPRRTVHVYGLTHGWTPADELGCHWADPELGIEWPGPPALLSERDQRAGSLRDLLRHLATAAPGRFLEHP